MDKWTSGQETNSAGQNSERNAECDANFRVNIENCEHVKPMEDVSKDIFPR